jgi:hypothetical protein
VHRGLVRRISVDALIGVDFRRHDPPGAPPLQSLADNGFAVAIAVSCCRIEQGDA